MIDIILTGLGLAMVANATSETQRTIGGAVLGVGLYGAINIFKEGSN